ncbi:hypothetical protein H703_00949 [Bartonella bacilliformis Ver075]|nr:hypothetical protein H703_00949 [Bartonella bacilliformis Ver075]
MKLIIGKIHNLRNYMSVKKFRVYGLVLMMKQEPAYTIIKFLRGANKVSCILHKSKGSIYRTTYSKEKGVSNGLFPAPYQANDSIMLNDTALIYD